MTTAPYFPLYLKDWMSDTRGFSFEARGAFIEMLCIAWERGGLPRNPHAIGALVMAKPAQWRRIWPVVQANWVERDGLWIYPKLEVLRDHVERRSKAGQVGASTRWTASKSQCDGNAIASESHPNRNSTTDTRQQIPNNRQQTTSTELANANSVAPSPSGDLDSPSALRFPTVGVGGGSWPLSEAQVAVWAGLFPALDVLGECQRALAWILAKPSRRKTDRGMAAFLVGWLGRSNDRARDAPTLSGPMTRGERAEQITRQGLAEFLADTRAAEVTRDAIDIGLGGADGGGLGVVVRRDHVS